MATPLVTMRVKALFFDSERVKRAVDPARRRALSKSGAEVRKMAKRAMEQSAKAGRISERELPEDLRRRRRIANRIRKREGRPRLKPLNKPSRPGQAPAARRSSPLNKLTLFAFDPRTESVVVGPVGFAGSKAPEVLEEGGRTRIGDRRVRIAPRPYMGPALKQEIPNMPRRWRNSVRGR